MPARHRAERSAHERPAKSGGRRHATAPYPCLANRETGGVLPGGRGLHHATRLHRAADGTPAAAPPDAHAQAPMVAALGGHEARAVTARGVAETALGVEPAAAPTRLARERDPHRGDAHRVARGGAIHRPEHTARAVAPTVAGRGDAAAR